LQRGALVLVTVYAGAKAPVPVAQDELTWPELCDEIEGMAEIEYADKLHMLAIGPHELRVPYRALANVVAVTLMVIDVDKIADLAALLERAEALAPCMVYESPSSTDDAPRVRVLAPVARPIAVDECERTRFAFAEALGLAPGQGVEGAKDAAKLFFVGRLAGTEPRRVWRY
jgi:hypothetical protein